MSLIISSHSISKSYGSQTLFNNISIGVSRKERLGLIGPNGAGKSTLLKIFNGIETPDQGKITLKHGAHTVYLPQEEELNPDQTILEVLEASFDHELEETELYSRIQSLSKQEFFSNTNQKVTTLSGGWKKRLVIVRAMIQEADLLLLDEPTNHLDLEGILWLENLLKQARFAFVLVSHDRCFLENITNRMVELNPSYAEGYLKVEGNYSDFLQKRNSYFQDQSKQEEVLSNKVRKEIEWLKRGPKARTTKAKYRINNAQLLQNKVKVVQNLNSKNRTPGIGFDATKRKTKKLLEAKNLQISLGNRLLFESLDLTLSPGSCLGLLGKNGSGKSTLMKLLLEELKPDSGSIRLAEGVQIVYFDQQREHLNQNQILMQALSPQGDSIEYQGRSIHVVAWAKRFLFPKEFLRMPVSQLSGGEQARVLISQLMLRPADILLLDEPTNDLDIPTLEVFEESLKEFPGSIVLITHDRYLLDRLSDRILFLDGSGKAEYFADLDQWLSHQQVKSQKMDSEETKPNKKKRNKLTFEQQKELGRIEKKIQREEEKLLKLQNSLQNPEIMSDAQGLSDLAKQIQVIEEKIEENYSRWETLENIILD